MPADTVIENYGQLWHSEKAFRIFKTDLRIRPIFMSTLTSVFGMAPLVLFPGAGSELYRGLGAVVIGGLMLSALLTLFIIPPMLKIIMPWVEQGRSTSSAGRTRPAE